MVLAHILPNEKDGSTGRHSPDMNGMPAREGARAGLSQVIKPMSNYDKNEVEACDRRTVRACVESMTVVPHGEGTGMFDVYSGTNAEPYVVDLAGENDRCTCPDVQHNLSEDERCKHSRRVRLEFSLAPFEDIPPVRDEHAAPMDVELARKRRGIDVEPEPEPATVTVADAKSESAVAMTDGGVVLDPETHPEDVEDTAAPDLSGDAVVSLHGVIAETTSTTEDLPDFDVFCTAVEISTQHIWRLVEHEAAP